MAGSPTQPLPEFRLRQNPSNQLFDTFSRHPWREGAYCLAARPPQLLR